jgi:preprotein translocase subunit SecG
MSANDHTTATDSHDEAHTGPIKTPKQLLAAVFFSTSLALAYIASHKTKVTGSVMQDAVTSQPVSVPAAEGTDKPAIPVDTGSKTKEIPK